MKTLEKLRLAAEERVKENGAQYTAFGLFGLFNYPLYHFIWIYLSKQPYSNLLLRLIATLLCLFLALNKFWPKSFKKYLPLYWYATLLYCLPFFFAYMLIKNNFSSIWLANSILVFYFLILLVDFKTFNLLFITGSAIGILLGYITPMNSSLNNFIYPVDYVGIALTYLVSFIIGGLFARNKEKIDLAKLHTMRALGATVAHELRTPLATIRMTTKTIKRHLLTLQEEHFLKSSDNDRNQERYHEMKEAVEMIEGETRYSNTIIDMILENSKENGLQISQFQLYSANTCIKEAMARYPFQPNERDLVSVSFDQDFLFKGDKVAMINVLFNLLRNALYFIAVEQKGYIEIWSEIGQTYNTTYFKDTAKGIPEQDSQKLFEPFFTTTRHGTGLGLAYCKKVMLSFGGDIACTSESGKFTLFTMYFLKI